MNRRVPRRTARSASCMVARQLISQVSFGSRSPQGSFATNPLAPASTIELVRRYVDVVRQALQGRAVRPGGEDIFGAAGFELGVWLNAVDPPAYLALVCWWAYLAWRSQSPNARSYTDTIRKLDLRSTSCG